MAHRRWLVMLVFVGGCTCGRPPLIPADGGGTRDGGLDGQVPTFDAYMPPDGGPPPDRGPLNPDAACASQTASAIVERLPVDIIWMVDNSVSMAPAIEQVQAGLNDFAALIGGRDLDYRVIMLSMRGEGEVGTGTSRRYQVCIPPPLAGDTSCGDGPRFFHVHVDIRSTQPLEQFLGTLGQTAGYVGTGSGNQIGSLPWHELLRPEATKTIVVVTDDNARMVARDPSGGFVNPTSIGATGDPVATADWFETTAAGQHPFASTRTLPEGILHARWAGLFDDYIFSGLYGWGSETDDGVTCEFPDGTSPPASGRTYSELVRRTGGVRAQLCDGAAAWGPFFDGVATAVEQASRIDCTIPIPEAPEGSFFDRTRINVFVDLGEGDVRVGKVADPSACDDRGGWHYDDELDPASVILCPATCEALQAAPGETRRVDVQFGCQTIPI